MLKVFLCSMNLILYIIYQSGGIAVFAMDALFGLPRKKSAGVSYRDPLYKDLLFCDQSEVDQFVAESEQSKSTPNVRMHVYMYVWLCSQ